MEITKWRLISAKQILNPFKIFKLFSNVSRLRWRIQFYIEYNEMAQVMFCVSLLIMQLLRILIFPDAVIFVHINSIKPTNKRISIYFYITQKEYLSIKKNCRYIIKRRLTYHTIFTNNYLCYILPFSSKRSLFCIFLKHACNIPIFIYVMYSNVYEIIIIIILYVPMKKHLCNV